MRKHFWLATPFILTFALLLFFTVYASRASQDGLALIEPAQCPESGCAPGQRLNFSVQFTVSNLKPNPNTQLCIYAPEYGQDDDDGPWADFSTGWISETGLVSGQTYTPGQVNSICTDNAEEDETWLAGAYASLITEPTDELEFALHIHPEAEVDGNVRVKILEPDLINNTWVETSTFNLPIELAQLDPTVYVANTPETCDKFTPCYVNSGDDLPEGLGTGLRDAVMSVETDGEILILEDYVIKDHTVLIDKNVHLRGHTHALITYIGTQCDDPMLTITQGGTISELTINDGNCFSPSRTLLEVDSALPVQIEHNTLAFGNNAIFITDSFGDITVAFNHIINNNNYAVLRDDGNRTGQVNIYANNIINNKTGYQVDCSTHGTANHNFWGAGQSATANAGNCAVTNGKRLGALIQLALDRPGVQAQRLPVTTSMSYAFDGKIGAQRTTGSDFDLIIVNHGQGTTSNIPFYQVGTTDVQPCSNFYDIFLADDAAATNLTLALRYDLNSNCISLVESSDYCGSNDPTKYPLLWYDPATWATDGWDRVGQNPQGPGAGGASGQETTCHLNAKEIRVVIDNTGRPSISSDLNYTPFVVGLPFNDGIILTQFTAQFDGTKNQLRWDTSREVNVRGFYVLRSETSTGPYARISNQITAIGDTYIGGIYQYIDDTIVFAKTYYYKIEVIDINGASIATHGPVSVLTATATPTATMTFTPTSTPTRTGTPTPTRTPFFYRSPTPFYRYATPTPFFQPRTATPVGGPTQVRTFGPTIEGTDDGFGYPIDDDDFDFDDGYPEPDFERTEQWQGYPPGEGYPQPESPDPTSPYPAPDSDTEDPTTETPTTGGLEGEELPMQAVRWIFIIVGAAGGLSLLGAISVFLAKSRFS
ncbi:MAG: hypothetical protein ACNA70_01475 [Brevefilum sp.]